ACKDCEEQGVQSAPLHADAVPPAGSTLLPWRSDLRNLLFALQRSLEFEKSAIDLIRLKADMLHASRARFFVHGGVDVSDSAFEFAIGQIGQTDFGFLARLQKR